VDWSQAAWLAVLQGLLEFLPISSSGHLVLMPRLAGWADQGLAFDVAVHVGTLAAVLGYGLALEETVASRLREPAVIAWATIGFGLLLGAADRWGRRRRPLERLRWQDALAVGLAQALALIPGASRSGVTMTAGLALGLTREAAARFSFLLAIPVILLAGGYEGVKLARAGAAVEWGLLAFAAGVAAATAWAVIALFLRWVERVGMLPFVLYRLALGGLLLWAF